MLAARSLLLSRAFALVTAASLAVACTASAGDGADDGAADPASATGEDALTSPRSVSLMYEGSCAFLHNCSAWSRKLPAGEVQWGCGGTDCSDDELWTAGPSHSYCNRKAKICHGTRCTTATLRDISDAHGWEASNGVLDAIGMAHTVNVSAYTGGGGGKEREVLDEVIVSRLFARVVAAAGTDDDDDDEADRHVPHPGISIAPIRRPFESEASRIPRRA